MKMYETPDFTLTEFTSEDIITISVTVGDDVDQEVTVSAW